MSRNGLLYESLGIKYQLKSFSEIIIITKKISKGLTETLANTGTNAGLKNLRLQN